MKFFVLLICRYTFSSAEVELPITYPEWSCWIQTRKSCFLGVMAVLLKLGIGPTASTGRCCSQGTPSPHRPRGAATGRWRGGALFPVPSSMRPPSVLAFFSVVLARNKVVADVAQQPVRHPRLPDLAGCCPSILPSLNSSSTTQSIFCYSKTTTFYASFWVKTEQVHLLTSGK
jgi:hypothetical protein